MAGPNNQNESNTNNRLNLFKFASRRKSSNDGSKSSAQKPEKIITNAGGDTETPDAETSGATPNDDDELDPINSTEYNPNDENIQSYPPSSYFDTRGSQSYLQSPTSPSESSLIFERSVEDPNQVYQQTTCPRCGQQTNNNSDNSNNTSNNNSNKTKLTCNHQSIVNLPSHYSVENFVSPCLDATTKILTDETTDLDNVDMVYSRRPSSVMGLNMALGRNRSYVGEDSNGLQTPFSPSSRTNSSLNISKTNSLANVRDLDSSKRPPTLSFYSYADMINNENPNPKRPSISQSLSSSFINTRGTQSRSNSISTNLGAGNSITPQRHNIINPLSTTTSAASNQRSSFSNPFNNHNNNSTSVFHHPSQSSHSKKKFQITPDSPNSSDSEPEYHPTHPRSNRNSINSKLNKTYSNQSSVNQSIDSQVHSGASSYHRRYSNLDDGYYGSEDNESLVISSIGDHLRRNNGEIKSSNNSIIA